MHRTIPTTQPPSYLSALEAALLTCPHLSPPLEEWCSHTSLGKAKCSQHSVQSSCLPPFLLPRLSARHAGASTALIPGQDHSTAIINCVALICHPDQVVSATKARTLSPSQPCPRHEPRASLGTGISTFVKEMNTLVPTWSQPF